VDAVRAAVDEHGKIERTYLVDRIDAEGTVHASVEKLPSIRRKPV
jgi:hypothetical protein